MYIRLHRDNDEFFIAELESRLLLACGERFGYTHEEGVPPQDIDLKNGQIWFSQKQSFALASALRRALREIPKTDSTKAAYAEAENILGAEITKLVLPTVRLTLDNIQLPVLALGYTRGLALSREFLRNVLSGPNRKVVEDFVAFLERGEHFVTTVCRDCAQHRLSLQ
jgi:hypothetical protein